MDRRVFLGGLTAGLGIATAWRSRALELGSRTLRTVSDGNLQLPSDFLFGPMPQDELAPILARHDVDLSVPLTPPCNITLLQDEDRVILFDAGAGTNFQDGVGNLVDALDAINIAPEDVTHVVFTHGHPDHLWGVLDDFDDPMFPEATHLMGAVEHAYWTDPETMESIGEARAAFAAGARRRLEAISDAIELFGPEDEILPGIAAVPTPGHTPGHTAFHIASGDAQAMVVGDAIGNDHVAFERPEWPSGSDQDAERAMATRTALLDRLAADRIAMVGFHLPEGGMGRVERAETGYRFTPEAAAD
jgi:glyoxylase-like metal-dependent hydrolase (beta-lactamase superfamily II)